MNAAPPVRVLHVITGLNTGGAEMMLLKVLRSLDLEQHVLTLRPGGTLRNEIEQSAAAVHDLDLTSKRPLPLLKARGRLREISKHIAPTHIMGWMYHGNLAANVAASALRHPPKLLWNIRHSLHDITHETWPLRAVIYLGKVFSSRPETIVYNSGLSAKQHEAYGYPAAQTRLIPNGFDVDTFKPDVTQRLWLRSEFNIPKDHKVITLVARNHPMKDHRTALKAFKALQQTQPNCSLLLVGKDVKALKEQAEDTANITYAGLRKDIARIWQGSDIGLLSSAWGEGFPNVLGEAMACGVPCVTTDVGDAGWIVMNTGRTLSPGDYLRMASALEELLTLSPADYKALSAAARNRIVSEFSLKKISNLYHDALIR